MPMEQEDVTLAIVQEPHEDLSHPALFITPDIAIPADAVGARPAAKLAVRAIRMQPSDPVSWVVMPQIRDRIVRSAIEEYGSCPPQLVLDFWMHWLAQAINPGQCRIAVWARVEEDLHVSTHVMAEICNDHGVPFVAITQTAVDKGYPFDAESNRATWAEIEAWGRQFGCVEVRTLARTPAVARLDRRLYGLAPVEGRVPMRKDLR